MQVRLKQNSFQQVKLNKSTYLKFIEKHKPVWPLLIVFIQPRSQGLSSYRPLGRGRGDSLRARPSGGKMRDPGNEVELSFTIYTSTNMVKRCAISHLSKVYMKSSGDIPQPSVNI